jgi:hypothetical protein
MADISSLYPAPPQNQANSLASNPAAVIGLMQNINALRSKQAIGNAFQGAIGANGDFDPVAAATAIKNDPNAAWGAPEAVGNLLEARGKQISNSTAQFGLQASQNQEAQRLLAGFAQDPSPSDDKIRQWSASMARAGIDPTTINGLRQDLLSRSMNDRKTVIGNTANTVMGAAAASSPENLISPATGQPTRVPHGAFSSGPQGIATGLNPQSAADIQEYQKDQAESTQKLASVRQLEQAYPLLKKMSAAQFGPTSEAFSQVKNGLVSLGLLDPKSTIADADTMRQEVGKKLNQFAILSPGGSRSNEGLAAAFHSNPGLFLSKEANINLLRDQIGMEKQDAAKTLFAGSPNNYQTVRANHYLNTDPRGFVLHLMDAKERAALKNDPNAAKIQSTAHKAVTNGIMPAPVAPNAGQ